MFWKLCILTLLLLTCHLGNAIRAKKTQKNKPRPPPKPAAKESNGFWPSWMGGRPAGTGPSASLGGDAKKDLPRMSGGIDKRLDELLKKWREEAAVREEFRGTPKTIPHPQKNAAAGKDPAGPPTAKRDAAAPEARPAEDPAAPAQLQPETRDASPVAPNPAAPVDTLAEGTLPNDPLRASPPPPARQQNAPSARQQNTPPPARQQNTPPPLAQDFAKMLQDLMQPPKRPQEPLSAKVDPKAAPGKGADRIENQRVVPPLQNWFKSEEEEDDDEEDEGDDEL